MLPRQQATIRTLLIVEYSNILNKARKGLKGLRLPHISSVVIVGDRSKDGIACCEVATITNSSNSAAYQKLNRVLKAGFIYKSNKRYYLTDTGRKVYDTICREFKPAMDKIVKILVDETQSRLKRMESGGDDLGRLG